MTKTDLVEAEKPQGGTGVATYDYGADAGAGFEGSKPSDFKPSFLRVLQSNSPQVVDALPGAKAGLFIDSITNEMFDNILFVPAVREHVYVAWKPRNEGGGGGEGFGGVFQLDDPMVVKQLATVENKFERGDDGKLILPRTPDGEFQLVETVYFHGPQLIEESGAVIPATVPLSSTGLPVAAAWFTMMRKQIIPGVGKPFPLFAHVFRLGSNKVTKKGNTWFVPTVAWGKGAAVDSRLDPKGDVYTAAKQLATSFKEGKVKVDYAAGGQGDGPAKKSADEEIPF